LVLWSAYITQLNGVRNATKKGTREMNADNFVLPDYWDIAEKSEELNSLEIFIYNNEPAGNYEDQFRQELEDAIKYVIRKAQEK